MARTAPLMRVTCPDQGHNSSTAAESQNSDLRLTTPTQHSLYSGYSGHLSVSAVTKAILATIT